MRGPAERRLIGTRLKRRLRLGTVGLGVASLGLLAWAYAPPQAQAAPGPHQGPPAWLTPRNQPALDAAANEAQAVADASYFTGDAVNTHANIVDVYLDHAPQAVLHRLRAMHPGTYVFHNASAHPLGALLSLEASISARVLSWAASGVRIGYLQPTLNGFLKIGVTTDVTAAASQLGAAYGHGWIRVVRDNEPMVFAAFRYSDFSPWNGGDFIYHESSTLAVNCSSGIPVHNTTTGTLYMLTASHCFWAFGGVGTSVHNGYVENDGTVYPGSSKTKIGSVTKNDNVSAGTTSLDTALIQTSTSVDDFAAAWNSQGTAIQVGEAANHVGDSVCTSGAFEGQICDSLSITSLDNTRCGTESWGTFCVENLAEANSGSTEHVAMGQGDSGGPVYSYSGSNLLARGMIDGGTDSVSCTSVPTGTSGRLCFANVFFVEMAHINSNWGIVPNS